MGQKPTSVFWSLKRNGDGARDPGTQLDRLREKKDEFHEILFVVRKKTNGQGLDRRPEISSDAEKDVEVSMERRDERRHWKLRVAPCSSNGKVEWIDNFISFFSTKLRSSSDMEPKADFTFLENIYFFFKEEETDTLSRNKGGELRPAIGHLPPRRFALVRFRCSHSCRPVVGHWFSSLWILFFFLMIFLVWVRHTGSSSGNELVNHARPRKNKNKKKSKFKM